ncbi:MAG: phage tail assembly chaperone [Pseudomonadota bacterium]
MTKWRDWFAFAVLRLGLAPASFWALTVAEWTWLLEASLGTPAEAMTAAGLNNLLTQYPDGKS